MWLSISPTIVKRTLFNTCMSRWRERAERGVKKKKKVDIFFTRIVHIWNKPGKGESM